MTAKKKTTNEDIERLVVLADIPASPSLGSDENAKGRQAELTEGTTLIKPIQLEEFSRGVIEKFGNDAIQTQVTLVNRLVKEGQNMPSILQETKKLSHLIKEYSDQLTGKEKELATRQVQIDIKERGIDDREKQFKAQIKKLREEEAFLLGKTRFEKIQILISTIKDAFVMVNELQNELEADGVDISRLPNYAREIIRRTGPYSFSGVNAKMCQSYVIQILKYFNLLVSGHTFSYAQQQDVHYIRGILTNLHARFDFITNHIDTIVQQPLELRRLFSALEVDITNYAGLDNEETEIKDYDAVCKSFESFNDEEKERFLLQKFLPEYAEDLDDEKQNDILSSVMPYALIPPETVIDQMVKWDKYNQTYNPKFIELLKVELSPKQKMAIADSEIKELKDLWKNEQRRTT